MDILLINSCVKMRNFHAAMTPPLGLAYIGAVLLKAGYSVAAIDLNVTPFTEEELTAHILCERPKLIGISAYTETYNNAAAIARAVKAAAPDIKVVIGGPHVSVMYAETAREGVFDAVERGEGEITMLELARLYVDGVGALDEINGLAFMRGDKLIVTPAREPIANVDELPFPARELFPLEAYMLPVAILTSRGGCPFACSFCAVNNIWKGKRRFRSPENVMAEIDYVLEHHKFAMLNFSDDSFTLDRARVMKLCAMIKAKYGPMSVNWQCATRVDLIDEELIRAMRAAGCTTIQYGVESGSQQILDEIGKKIRLEQVQQAVALSHKYGINTLCSFMFPHPGDTVETIARQTALMKRLADEGVQLSLAMTTPYPGTPLHSRLAELGVTLHTDNWDDFDCQHIIISTKNFTRDELKEQLQRMVTGVGLSGGIENN